MENAKKNYIFNEFNKIKEWIKQKIEWAIEMINQEDIPDNGLDSNPNLEAEVKEIEAVQAKVREQNGFVPKAQVNEEKAQVVAKGKNKGSKGTTKVLGEA